MSYGERSSYFAGTFKVQLSQFSRLLETTGVILTDYCSDDQLLDDKNMPGNT